MSPDPRTHGDRRPLPLGPLVLAWAGFAFACAVLGAVEPWSQCAMGGIALAAFLAMLASGRLRSAPGQPADGRVRLLLPEAFFLGFLVLGLLQLVPLPQELHRTLSPEAARVWDRGLPAEDHDRWRTLSLEPFATRLEILRFAALAMVFSLFARGLRGVREARLALGGFVALGALCAVLGIADQVLGGDLLGYYPRESRFEDRLAGVLVNPNHFAGMMTMTALGALGLYFAVAASGAEEEGLSLRALVARGLEAGTNRGPAVALLLGLLVCTAALLLTASRLGTFSFLVGLAVFALGLSRTRHPGRALGALGVVTAFLLLANVAVTLDPVLERWSFFFGGDGSAEGRVLAWQGVFAMGEKFMACGSGLGTFEHVFPAYQPAVLTGTWDRAHNDFLQLFADGGLSAVLLATGLLLSWFDTVGRAALSAPPGIRPLAAGTLAAVAALLVHASGDFNFQIPGNAYLLAALMGIGWAAAAAGKERPPGVRRAPSNPGITDIFAGPSRSG